MPHKEPDQNITQDDQSIQSSAISSDRKYYNPALEALLSNPRADATILVNTLIQELSYIMASDILLEPEKEYIRVRARIDGVLYDFGIIPQSLYPAVSSRIKVICNLDLTRKNQVQEGQFTVEHENGIINFRVEIVETVNGELIVLRLHEKRTIVMKLSELGFGKQAYDEYLKMLNQKSGLVLVCGPTGTGKTTTLYSTLTSLNENKIYNIMTVEDPVEFHLDGTNQIQTNKDRNFTFATGLRTILRLSPDVVLVGEIRDKETAEIAVESGLTGLFVLSTVHAEDAVGALFRMLDLDVEAYLLNSSLVGIVAQRLARRNCHQCLEEYTPNQKELEFFTSTMGRPPNRLVRSRGCPTCQNLKYKGRIAIYEVLRIDAKIRDLIRNKAGEQEFRNALKEAGFTTLLKDGLLKCEQGITTIDEVLRNSLRVE